MIADSTEILQIVTDIENRYNMDLTTNLQYAILDSKLAIIEFCGWVEQTFDNILQDYCILKLADPNSELYTFTKKIIDDNYGFDYKKNLRKLLLSIIGIRNLEDLEDTLDNTSASLSTFKSILGTFSSSRNTAAHTYTPTGTTARYDSPSIVLNNIKKITPILQKIEQEIMKY